MAQSTRAGLCFLLCLIGCTTANVKSPTAAAPPSAPDAPLAQTKLEVARQAKWDFADAAGERTPIIVALPNVGHWQVDDRQTTWWVAINTPLDMRLEAKFWPERRLVTWQECLADFGRWRGTSGESIISNAIQSKDASVPAGFASRLIVTINKGAQGSNSAGSALLIGADIARCFAFVASVQPSVALKDDELMARIALATEGIIPRIRSRSIEQRLEDGVKR